MADALACEKLIGQLPRFEDKERDCGEKLRIPIQERVKHIGDNVAEGAAVIDGGLPALPAIVAGKLCAAVLAVRQQSIRIFVSTEPAPARDALDSGNRCVTEDNFCRFIGHTTARLQKVFIGVDCA